MASDKPPLPRYRLFKDKKGEWRWSYIARNGEIIATSSEGYANKADCRHGIELVKGSLRDPVWVDDAP